MRYKTHKKYAGVVKKGTIPMVLDKDQSQKHLMRVLWLIAQVDCGGTYGTVQNYDGTGITAGIFPAAAVSAKYKWQGLLFRLLGFIQHGGTLGLGDKLFTMLDDAGFTINANDWLVYKTTGLRVSKRHIRKEFTGAANGVMPRKGFDRSRAEEYVRAFNALFSDERSYELQIMYGLNYLIYSGERSRIIHFKGDQKRTIQSLIYSPYKVHLSTPNLNKSEIPEELELAMCVFWSYYINASFKAVGVLYSVCTKTESLETLPEDLIRALGISLYGDWSHRKPNGRYQRIRNAAKKLGYDPKLFRRKEGIMPKGLR